MRTVIHMLCALLMASTLVVATEATPSSQASQSEVQAQAPMTRDYIRRRQQIDYAQYVRLRKKLATH